MTPAAIWTALEIAYKDYAANLMGYCRARRLSKEDSEEVMHDAFTQTYEYLCRGNEVRNLQKFLYTVVGNLTIDLVRRSKYKQRNEVPFDQLADINEPSTSIEEKVQRKMQASNILQARKMLKPKEYELLVLRFVNNLPLQEIAKKTGLSANAVGIRLHRAIKQIESDAGMAERKHNNTIRNK